jgi:hypothetical protein
MPVPSNHNGVTITTRLVCRTAPRVGPKPWHITHHSSNPNDTLRRFYRFTTDGTTTTLTSANYTSKWLAPVAGRLLKVFIRPATAGGVTSVAMHLNDNTTVISSQEISVTLTANQVTEGSFAEKAALFNAGDTVAISMQPTSTLNDVVLTCVWELER